MNKNELEAKRKQAAAKIKEVAPHIDMLISMLDETKIDLLLIALAGAKILPAEEASDDPNAREALQLARKRDVTFETPSIRPRHEAD